LQIKLLKEKYTNTGNYTNIIGTGGYLENHYPADFMISPNPKVCTEQKGELSTLA